jgi:hypothetical protein
LLDAFGSACPEITFEMDYQWTGIDFQFTERRFPSGQDLPQPSETVDNMDACWDEAFELELSKLPYPADRLDQFRTLIDAYPLSSKIIFTGEPQPVDAREAMRYRLGMDLAWQGEAAAAREQMQKILTQSTTQASQRFGRAQAFLAHYHQASTYWIPAWRSIPALSSIPLTRSSSSSPPTKPLKPPLS